MYRFRACQSLNWSEIPAIVVELGEQERIIAECDKNPCVSPWPYSIPADLRRRFDSALGQRSHGAAEIWGVIRDWVEENGRITQAALTSSHRGGAQSEQ